MPPKKRKNSDVPPTMTKKRAKTTASHTATTSVNTNDPAILAITENTRNRAARRPVLNTPGLSGNQSQAVNEGDSHLTSQIIGNQSQPGVDVHTQMTRQIVDNISSTLESLVERKISEILGKNMPQTSTPMTDQEQHLNDRGIQSIQHEGHWNNLPNYNIVQTEHSTFTGTGISGIPSILNNSISLQMSPSIPLYASVPLKVKEKIWANEFVDFSTAFSKSADTFNITISSEGIQSLTPMTSRKFLNIEQWTDTFAVFSSVYRQKYPDSAEQLAQYCNTVRAIAKARGNWHFYDSNFRQLRQNHPFPWDSIHHELYIKALNQRQPFRSTGPQTGQSSKTCNRFNRGETCNGCSFSHRCRTCSGNHPQFKCWNRTSGADQSRFKSNPGQAHQNRSNNQNRSDNQNSSNNQNRSNQQNRSNNK